MNPSYLNPGVISVENLYFRYPPLQPLFREFNWDVKEGEIWSIIGPSGCGKTTLLYLISGLRQPLSGHIRVCDETVTGPSINIGLMLQDYGLLAWYTARDNIRVGLKIRGKSEDDSQRITSYWLKRLGIDQVAESFPHQLSGGQRQRVALARVLALQPKIMLLDEPFSSVDELTREKFQKLLSDLILELHLTMVLVTHSIEEAVLLGQKVLLLTNNRPTACTIFQSPFHGHAPSRRDSEFQEFCMQLRERLI